MSLMINFGLAAFMIVSFMGFVIITILMRALRAFSYNVMEKLIALEFFGLITFVLVGYAADVWPPTTPWITLTVYGSAGIVLAVLFYAKWKEDKL